MCDILSKWSGKLNQSQRQSARTKNAISKKKKKKYKKEKDMFMLLTLVAYSIEYI